MASDHYGFDPLSGTYTLIGLFGSKNQIGLFAEIGILFAVIGLSVRQRFVEKMAFTLIPIMVFALSLYLSKSVSSIISLAVILMAMCAAAFIGRMPRSFRTIVLIGFTLTVIMVGLFGAAFDVQDTVLKGFGKNATLTGRTFLWQEAINSGMKAPILGHGYAAFWVEGQPKAEQLWMKFGVTTKVGFHFHNVFLEVFVELGALGVAIIVFIMLANCWKSTRALLRNGMSVEYMYALGVSIMFLIRAMVEVDIIGTFSVGPLLFFSVLPRLADLERVKRDASPSKHGKEAATGSLTTMRMRQY
jgi:exopolysaccharide production protein ExoQ